MDSISNLLGSTMGQKALQLILQRVGVSQPQLLSLLNLGNLGSNQYPSVIDRLKFTLK